MARYFSASSLGFGPAAKDSSGSSRCNSCSFTTLFGYSLFGQTWRTFTWFSSLCVLLPLAAETNFRRPLLQLLESVTVNNSGNFRNPSSRRGVRIAFEVVLKLYISALLVVLVCSLRNRNRVQRSKWIYLTSMIFFGFCSLAAFGFAGYIAGTMRFPGYDFLFTFELIYLTNTREWNL